MKNNERFDVLSTKSEKSGVSGIVESLLRRFRTVGFVLLLSPIALIYVFCMGLAFSPGVMLGEGATIQPNDVLLPKTRVPDREKEVA